MTLVVVGDGPERAALERMAAELGLDGRVEFRGSVPRSEVLRLFRAADASLLPSAWENFPHTVVEALAVGCPVIATAVGGVPEVVRDGENGLLVPPGDPTALAAAITRFFADRDLRERLSAAAPASVAGYSEESVFGEIEAQLERVGGRVKRKLLLVGRSRYSLPLSPSLARKFDALSRGARRPRARGSGGGDGRRTRVSCSRPPSGRAPSMGPSFYALLPFRIARELRASRPDAVLAQGAQEAALAILGRSLARVPTRVIADVHGDPAAPARLYGSRARRALAPLADALARFGLRRSDGVRTISAYTSGLVRAAGAEPTAEFAAFMDLEPFLEAAPAELPATPDGALRRRPRALQGGRRARGRAGDSLHRGSRRRRLRIVGRGTLAEVARRLVADLPQQATWTEALSTEDVARALDGATVLVLPSRSEGLGRVVVEAYCRSRGVVGSRVGGIPDLVEDGVNGVLVDPGNAEALADALVRVLSDRKLAERLGSAGRAAVEPWLATPEEYARRIRELVDAVTTDERGQTAQV